MKYEHCLSRVTALVSLARLRPDLSPNLIAQELDDNITLARHQFPQENAFDLAHGWLWEDYRQGACESRDVNNR